MPSTTAQKVLYVPARIFTNLLGNAQRDLHSDQDGSILLRVIRFRSLFNFFLGKLRYKRIVLDLVGRVVLLLTLLMK